MAGRFFRAILCLLMVFQAVPTAMACGCGNGCCGACEQVVVCESCSDCSSVTTVPSDCSCGAVSENAGQDALPTVEPKEPSPSEPQPAEAQKPETSFSEEPTPVSPSAETRAPALDTTEAPLPPAPIAVPENDSAGPVTTTEQVLPGPATETTPAEQPASSGTEGLFDAAPASDPESTSPVTPETPAPADTTGLFDEPTASQVEETDTTESVPVETPETGDEKNEEAAPAEDPLDDLFRPAPASEPESEPAPETSEETEETPFDPFGSFSPALSAVGGLASDDYRVWSNRDATIDYQARLIRFNRDGVVLLKRSGETQLVSFAVLSDSDLAFVRSQVRAQRELLAKRGTGLEPVKVAVQSLAN